MKSNSTMKRLATVLLLIVPPLLLFQKLRSIPREPIPISSAAQEAEVRGAEAAAAEFQRAQ